MPRSSPYSPTTRSRPPRRRFWLPWKKASGFCPTTCNTSTVFAELGSPVGQVAPPGRYLTFHFKAEPAEQVKRVPPQGVGRRRPPSIPPPTPNAPAQRGIVVDLIAAAGVANQPSGAARPCRRSCFTVLRIGPLKAEPERRNVLLEACQLPGDHPPDQFVIDRCVSMDEDVSEPDDTG